MRDQLQIALLTFISFATFYSTAATITCSGGDTMIPLMEAWSNAIKINHPEHSVLIDRKQKLSALGFEDFMNGTVDCVTFVREPFESEINRYIHRYGHPPFLIPVAGGGFSEKGKTHALAVYINKKNPLNDIDLQQIDAIFSSTRKRGYPQPITKWGDLGVKGEYADKDIHIYSMPINRETGNPPGIVNYIKRRILLGGAFQSGLIEIPDQSNKGSLELIAEKISSDPYGIGLSGFGNTTSEIKKIAVSNGYTKSIEGTPDTVQNQTYPLSRTIYLMLRTDANLQLSEIENVLLNEALSERGQVLIKSISNGFLPLPKKKVALLRSSISCDQAVPLYHLGSLDFSMDTLELSKQGKIQIIGYNDMQEMVDRWNETFSAYNPELIFETQLEGTRRGPVGLTTRKSLFAPMGAPFEDDALASYQERMNRFPLKFKVAHASLSEKALSGPIAIFVHPENTMHSISIPELKNLFSGVTTSDVHLYGMDETTALGQFMRKEILHISEFSSTMKRFKQSRDVIKALSNDSNSIAFASAQIHSPNLKKLAISVEPSSDPVTLSEENLINGRYPLDRKLLIYVNQDRSGQISPLAQNYLNFVLSCAGQNSIEDSIKHYLPLNPSEISLERTKLQVKILGN